ncbi:hypothetical protein C8R44DRAFT_942885 [Mycena epipterygia]|nr:hypothetical protein C8R44DRAFT_942885 [Mycena epipterygia]
MWVLNPQSFASVDLTSATRRPRVPGLLDWSQVGYEKGLQPLPGDSLVAKTITAAQLASVYGMMANDGIDDTDGLQKAISDNPGSPDAFTLIQLPAGTINLSYTIYLSSNYLILRGAVGSRWHDLQLGIQRGGGLKDGNKLISGNATGGWLWLGDPSFELELKKSLTNS